MNLVTNLSGDFVGQTGSSRDISNEADYQSLIGYRMAADGILTTAATARTEQYRRSRYAPLALVSLSGDFSGIPAVEQEAAGPADSLVHLLVRRSQVRVTRRRYTGSWVSVHSIGGGGPFRLTLKLNNLGWRRILVESGPTFANWLLTNSVVRVLALTVVGFSGGSPLSAAGAAFSRLGNGKTLSMATRRRKVCQADRWWRFST